MSDSVTKYYEMMEEGQDTRPTYKEHRNKIVSEETKKQAFKVLVEYPEEVILEAARILNVAK